MLMISEIYECKNLAHLPTEKTTSPDRKWMSYFEKDLEHHVTVLTNLSINISASERHPYRLCVTSFSPSALKMAKFVGREFKRPVKIFLDLYDENSVPIEYWFNHNGTDFDGPLVISLRAQSQRE